MSGTFYTLKIFEDFKDEIVIIYIFFGERFINMPHIFNIIGYDVHYSI